tara:strand:+ start:148 stop:1209 length:1062 start_codon:yes stop_codon:yes gene_type:complete
MNDVKLQEGLQPIDKHLRPIKIGGQVSALEISTEDVRVRNLQVSGTFTANIDDTTKLPLAGGTMTGNIATTSDFTLDCAGDIELNADGGDIVFKDDTDTLATINSTGISIAADKQIVWGTNQDYIYGDGADIYIAKDDGDVVAFKDDQILSEIPLLIKESANAVADTASYGQIWVKTATPNELYFTTDAGNDIQLTSGTSIAGGGGGGSTTEFYETKLCNFWTNSVNNQFIPLAGYVIERDSITGQNEYVSMVAPYNGEVVRIMFRSEAAQNGTLEFDIFESSDGTEVPGAVTGVVDTSINIADDTSVTVDFSSMTSGTNALVKGRIYAIQIDTPSIPYDTNVTVVFKWDTTT